MASKTTQSLGPFVRGFLSCIIFTPVLGALCLVFSGTPRSNAYYSVGSGVGSLIFTAAFTVGLVFISSNTASMCLEIALLFSTVAPQQEKKSTYYDASRAGAPQPVNTTDFIRSNCESVIKNSFMYPCIADVLVGLLALGLLLHGTSQVARLKNVEDDDGSVKSKGVETKEGGASGWKKPDRTIRATADMT
ncbi:hypothetical protein HDU81_004230 [Chytriomyces hyalinus]|nr:hypothetical protein HDU81_004230 [Chytriomyces hyalinus]